MAKTITLSDKATPLLAIVTDAIARGELNSAMARAGVNEIQSHLFKLDAERPNELGGRRTHFYSSAAKSTNYASTADRILININQLGFRQRYEGGRIAPVKSKYLTIPAVSEAYGRLAREFHNLVLQFGRGGIPVALAEAGASQVKFGKVRKDGTRKVTKTAEVGGRVYYWLKKEVFQEGDPSVLPSDQKIGDAMIAGGHAYVKHLKAKGGSSGQ